MAMELSFSEPFFVGIQPLNEVEPNDRPTSVYQAVLSMPMEDQLRLASEVFGHHGEDAVFLVDSEEWPIMVLDKVRETNTCGDYTTPVDVWIDKKGDWTLNIYDDEDVEQE